MVHEVWVGWCHILEPLMLGSGKSIPIQLEKALLLTWPMAKLSQLFGITYLVGKIKFKLFFSVHWLSEIGIKKTLPVCHPVLMVL